MSQLQSEKLTSQRSDIMYAGQHLRDKIAPETFRKLVLIAVAVARAELLRLGYFS